MRDNLIYSVYGFNLPITSSELMQAEARRTKIEMLKREMGDKYLLAPLTTKLDKPIK
jgi:hypothetical protein